MNTKSEAIDPREKNLSPETGIDLSDERTDDVEEMEANEADDSDQEWENDEENEM